MRNLLLCALFMTSCQWGLLEHTREQNDIAYYEQIWDQFAPGDLLKMLDYSTANVESEIPQYQQTPIERRSSQAEGRQTQEVRRADVTSKDSQEEPEASSEFNYDRAYEEFVKQYFTSKANSDDDEDKDEDPHSAQVEDQESAELSVEDVGIEAQETKQVKAKQKCKKSVKNNQVCVVCRNAKNGEKSEKCSFSQESKPQRYAFEKSKSYKKQRDNEDEHDDDDEDKDSLEQEAAVFKAQEESDEVAGEETKFKATCSMQSRGKLRCYTCLSDGDKKDSKCYTPARNKSSSRNAQKTRKTQQRIYKRTISYSIEKAGSNGTALNDIEFPLLEGQSSNETIVPHLNDTLPPLAETIFIKVIKEKATLGD